MANDYVKGVTEMGKAIYPHLNKPDQRFQKEGIWKVTLELTPEHADKLIKQVDEGIKLAIKDSGNKSIKTANKPYKKTEDNTYTFNFKCKASGITKTGQSWEQKPRVFDTKGHPLPKGKLVWGGTDMKVAYEIIPYANNMLGAGVSLRLKAVQVINLVSGNGASADSYGFKEEDGYVAEAVESLPEEAKEASNGEIQDF